MTGAPAQPREKRNMMTDSLAEHYGDTLPIAIIGAGCRFPQANSLFEFWRRIADGEELISRFDAAALTAAGVDPALLQRPDFVPAASVIENAERFEWQFFGYSRQEAESIDPQQRLFLMCAWEALEMAGYQPNTLQDRVGVIGSCRMSTWQTATAADAQNIVTPATFQKLMGNDKDYLATRVAYKLGLRGPAYTVQTACSSSLIATHLACEAIASGEADMMLAGGASLSFPQQAGYFHREGMIFSRDGHCRPFSADADGTLVANGAGVVLLKRLDRAVEDGDAILAVIRGTATNNDGSDKAGFTAPSLSGQREVIQDALAIAGVSADTIGLVEAHGTATPLGDPLEIAALTEAWSPASPTAGQAAIGSLKSNLGHLDTAAGVGSLIKASLALWQQQIPPTLHFSAPNPAIDFSKTPFRVPTHLEPWPVPKHGWHRAAVSAFGIGGSNAHTILESAPVRQNPLSQADTYPLLLSARTPSALRALAQQHAARLSDREPGFSTNDYAATSLYHRSLFPCRVLLLASDADGWLAQLLDLLELSEREAAKPMYVAEAVALSEAQRQSWQQQLSADKPDWQTLFAESARRSLLPVAPFEGEICVPPRAAASDAKSPWLNVVETGHHCANTLGAQLDLSVLDEENQCVDALHCHYASALFDQLPLEQPLGDCHAIMALLNIPARYSDLMQRMLCDLTAAGVLVTLPDGYLLRHRPEVDAAGWLKRMREVGYHHLAALIARTGPELGNMLRGDVDPVSVVFPAAATDDVEHMYQEQPWSRYFNSLASSVLQKLAESRNAPIRILEIGGGTGGTTRDMLQALPPGSCSRYTFTDLGPLFLQKAQEKFRDYDFIDYQTFDMEQSPESQGLSIDHYDVIVAANVLHNSADLRQLFRRLTPLLKPEGAILLREITAPKKLFDFVFGALVPPIADTAQRHGELFACAEDWQAALNEAGLTQFAAFPAKNTPAFVLGEQILLAQRPAEQHTVSDIAPGLLSLTVAADEENRWPAEHLLHALKQALPPQPGQQLCVAEWYCNPVGAPSPLTLTVVQHGEHISVQANSTPLLQARWRKTRTQQPAHFDFSKKIPQPWQPKGDLWRWQWRGAELSATAGAAPKILHVPDDFSAQARFYQTLREALPLANEHQPLLFLSERLFDDSHQHAADWLPGFLAVARHEYPHSRLILADGNTTRATEDAARLHAPVYRWHENSWQTQILTKVPHEITARPTASGCHLFIGGLTPTGLAVANQQVVQGAQKLLFLVRREPRPAEAEQIARWRASGMEVVIDTAGDVTQHEEFDAALTRMAQHGPIDTVWHLVGNIDDRPISELDWSALQQVYQLRMATAHRLAAHQAQLSPNCTVYFSSAASVMGPRGQAAHASACCALERMASARCAQGYDTLAVAWGLWQITESLSQQQQAALAQRGMLPLETDAALNLLDQALAASWPTVAAMQVDGTRLQQAGISEADRLQFAELLPESTVTTASTAPAGDDLDRYLRGVLAKQLNCAIETIHDQSNLVQLGLDSLLFLDLNETLASDLGIKLNAESVLKAGTVLELKQAIQLATAPASKNESVLRQRLQQLEAQQPGWLDARGDVIDQPASNVALTPLQRTRWQQFATQPQLLYVEYDKPVSFPVEAFVAGWQLLLNRHALLNSSINASGEIVISPTPATLTLSRYDWRNEDVQEKQRALRVTMSRKSFDLTKPAPLEIALARHESGYRIAIVISTLLIDIESFRVLLRELHQSITTPGASQPALAFSPQTYQHTLLALAQQPSAKIETSLTPPSLPWKKGDEAAAFTIWRDALPASQWLTLKQQGEALGVSGSDILLAAWALTLRDWLQQPALQLRMNYTDRLPLHPHSSQLVTDASTLMPVALTLESRGSFLQLAEAVAQQRTQHLVQHLPGGADEVACLTQLPVAFTSLLGVRQAYSIPEVSDPLLGMPDYEYAAQAFTPLHLQALEEESALLFNIDQQEGWLPDALGEVAMLTLRQLLETLAAGEEAWHAPLDQLLPPDSDILAIVKEDA
ncbi:KR domain-containing protein [Pantoea sp. Acro-805]|uniref:KR domain-containing protein n=2 Tax=Candidatus Pantoea formicae TaxID=2608355 RepID=A0ABX0QVC2_9GAMM|nr:KR domain-containing protein [Pantoea formicae]